MSWSSSFLCSVFCSDLCVDGILVTCVLMASFVALQSTNLYSSDLMDSAIGPDSQKELVITILGSKQTSVEVRWASGFLPCRQGGRRLKQTIILLLTPRIRMYGALLAFFILLLIMVLRNRKPLILPACLETPIKRSLYKHYSEKRCHYRTLLTCLSYFVGSISLH